MYRDMIYTSLAKVNPAFLDRLSAYDRVEGFIDNFSEFAGDAHFQIERQIIEQYTRSEEYNNEKNDQRKVSMTLRHIDDSVMKLIPGLIEQALTPGSEMMDQLEREEDELFQMRDMYKDLFRDRGLDEGQSVGIIVEEGGLEELTWDMPEDRSQALESFLKQQLRAATEAYSNETEDDLEDAEGDQEQESGRE